MAEAPDQREERRFEYLDYTWMISVFCIREELTF